MRARRKAGLLLYSTAPYEQLLLSYREWLENGQAEIKEKGQMMDTGELLDFLKSRWIFGKPGDFIQVIKLVPDEWRH